jgi:3-oxoacyl-[acyl-carrier-protein] synthase I
VINPTSVHVLGLGGATAVGRTSWASAAAVRAGVTGFGEHPFMVDSVGERMRVAMAPWLEIACVEVDRFEALLLPAIDEALACLPEPSGRLRIGLALALPAPRPGLPSDLAQQLEQRILVRHHHRFSAIVRFEVGHAAGLFAIEFALGKLQRQEIDACLVAGVDSWLAPETLEWLEGCDQLHGGGALNNAWGLVPGEAAGAVLLGSGALAAPSGPTDLSVHVVATGRAFEPKAIKTPTICIGEGLTDALRAALSALPEGERVTDVYCDMNGEAYRADEFGFAGLRVGDAFSSLSDFVAPADCWGDVGAAGGSLHIVLAVIAAQKGYAKGTVALAWASSEHGERAAVLLAMGRS